MRLGNFMFMLGWLLLVFGLSGFFPGWRWEFFVASYLVSGSFFATAREGRLRLLVGWFPAFLSQRAYNWALRGGDILKSRDATRGD